MLYSTPTRSSDGSCTTIRMYISTAILYPKQHMVSILYTGKFHLCHTFIYHLVFMRNNIQNCDPARESVLKLLKVGQAVLIRWCVFGIYMMAMNE